MKRRDFLLTSATATTAALGYSQPCGSWPEAVTKCSKISGPKVTIGSDRILNVKGRPFFPLGARHIPLGADFALLRKVGFNCFRWTAFGTDTGLLPSSELPKELGGLMFYAYLYDRGDFSRNEKERRQDLNALIRRVREHPSFLCYEQRNEPAFSCQDQRRPQSLPEGLIAGSDFLRDLDPHHPIRIAHNCHNLVSTLKKYNRAADMIGCNPYVVSPPHMRPVVGCRSDGRVVDSPNQTLSAVGDFTSKMMRVAEGRPVWMQLQATAHENFYNEDHHPEFRGQGIYEHHRLYPTYWQMRFMAFNAIIRGATAIEWSLFRLPTSEGCWMDVSRVMGDLSSLHDVLGSPVWPGRLKVEYKELGFSDWTGVETLVKLRAGKAWILAANTQFDPMEATFSALPPGVDDTLEAVGENREIKLRNDTFADRFQPYEVHVYAPRSKA